VVRVVAGGGLPLAVAATPHNRVRIRVLMVGFITGEVIRVQWWLTRRRVTARRWVGHMAAFPRGHVIGVTRPVTR
jgi:hypothetical protein